MEVKFTKLNDDAVTPRQMTEGAAGFDLYATSITRTLQYVEYGTGIAVEIPTGYAGFLFARSSCSDKGLSLCNGVGVIDADYRGELKVRYYSVSEFFGLWEIGERVAQISFLPLSLTKMIQVDSLKPTERGEGGFGSTDTEETDS